MKYQGRSPGATARSGGLHSFAQHCSTLHPKMLFAGGPPGLPEALFLAAARLQATNSKTSETPSLQLHLPLLQLLLLLLLFLWSARLQALRQVAIVSGAFPLM